MKKSIFFLIICILFNSGCASTRTLMIPQAVEGQNIETVYHDGYPGAISSGKDSTIIARLDKEDPYLSLLICYNNISERSIVANPMEISVVAVNKKEKEHTLKVYSSEEILESMQNKQMWGAILMGVSSGLSSYNAGRTTTYSRGTVYGNTRGSLYTNRGLYGTYTGSTSGFYSGTTTTYDPTKAQMVRNQNAQQMAMYMRATEENYNATEQGLLKINTLFPKQYCQGKVCIKYKKAIKYVISVPFGDDLHKIEFAPSKEK